MTNKMFLNCVISFTHPHTFGLIFYMFCCIKAVKVTVNYDYLCFHLSKKL